MSERSYADDAAAPPPRGTVEVGHLPPRWNPTPPRPRRPIGVAILAFVISVAGVVVLLSGVFSLVNGFLGPVLPGALFLFPAVDLLGAAILLLLGAVMIAIANALWDQERWALWTTIVGTFLAVTYLFFTQSISVLFVVLLVLFVYLLAVRRYFY
ncbi:MAG TPA: hypothetical protein VFF67_06665 [Thermoplasmata archaeon]|nr:hypothetical protein [Thermoplasmata archaeon]